MRELYFNREQQKHIIHNEKKILEVSQGQLLPDIGAFRKREMLSTILSNEKVKFLAILQPPLEVYGLAKSFQLSTGFTLQRAVPALVSIFNQFQ